MTKAGAKWTVEEAAKPLYNHKEDNLVADVIVIAREEKAKEKGEGMLKIEMSDNKNTRVASEMVL